MAQSGNEAWPSSPVKSKKDDSPKSFSKTVHGYAEASTVHGIVYIFESINPWWMKLAWAVIVLVFLALSVVSAALAYDDWRTHMVTTSLQTTSMPISDVDFPAITICPQGLLFEGTKDALIYQLETLAASKGHEIPEGFSDEDYKKKDAWSELLPTFIPELFPGLLNSSNFHALEHIMTKTIALLSSAKPEAMADIDIMTFGDHKDECIFVENGLKEPHNNCPQGSMKILEDMEYFLAGDCIFVTEELQHEPDVCTKMLGYSLGNTKDETMAKDFMKIIKDDNDIKKSYFWVDIYMDLENLTPAFHGQNHSFVNASTLFEAEGDLNLTLTMKRWDDTYRFRNWHFQAKLDEATEDIFTFRRVNNEEKARFICHLPKILCGNSSGLVRLEPDKNMDYIYQHANRKQRDVLRLRNSEQQRIMSEKIIKGKSVGTDKLMELLVYSQFPCFDFSIVSPAAFSFGILKECIWKQQRVPCSKIFEMVPTELGMCCAFNLDKADKLFWEDLDYVKRLKRLQDDAENTAFEEEGELPKNWGRPGEEPISQEGLGNGLSIVLDWRKDMVQERSLLSDYDGLLIMVDSKERYPRVKEKGILIRSGEESFVQLSATKMDAEQDIRDIDIDKRNCYFADEYDLAVHKSYTQSNCLTECIQDEVMYQMEKQGIESCIPWFFPSNETICDPWQGEVFNNLMRIEQVKAKKACQHCLPDCQETNYEVSMSSAPFRRCDGKNLGLSHFCSLSPPPGALKYLYALEKEYEPLYVPLELQSQEYDMRYTSEESIYGRKTSTPELYDRLKRYNAFETDIARVHFSFKSPKTNKFTRQPTMTTIAFISQIGGLIGLFMGFSFISVFEVVYWFTFRFYKNGKAD